MFVFILIMFIGCSMFVGCSKYKYVLGPPEVDLISHENIGLISFATENAEGQLDEMATQRFLQVVTQVQRGAQLIELGTLDEVLSKVNRPALDQEAVRAIGGHFNVKAFFFGKISVSDVKPQVSISAAIKSLGVRATFNISMTSRLYSTVTGATLWTDSVYRKESLANLQLSQNRVPFFNVKDQDETYTRLIENMVYGLTRDFRPTRLRVRKDAY